MKTYRDFTSDLISDPDLANAVQEAFPFDTVEDLQKWFRSKGYAVGDDEAKTIFEHQQEFAQDGQPLEY